MTNGFLAKTLKRIYDECQRAQDSGDETNVGKTLIGEFNDLLDRYQAEYPEQEVIQSINHVSTSGAHGSAHPQDVQEVKLNVLKIADSLGLDTDDFQQSSSSETLTTINIQQEQNQEQTQSQIQRVTVEQVIEDVEGLMISPDDKEELQELVREYETELESEDPDPSRFRDIVNSAENYSDDVARKLIMLATERGFNILTGLS